MPEGRVLLTDVSWGFYEHLLDEIGERSIRVTYDRGHVEIMAPSYRHERGGSVLAGLLEVLADELAMPMICAGSTTFRREDLDRGLEPDNCFYIANVDRILGKDEIDPTHDPPPDLAIEVDITSSSLDRMGIYAALGVPEVWRYQDDSLTVYQLGSDQAYEPCSASPTFPLLPLAEVMRFLDKRSAVDDMTLRRQFREWIRRDVLPRANPEDS